MSIGSLLKDIDYLISPLFEFAPPLNDALCKKINSSEVLEGSLLYRIDEFLLPKFSKSDFEDLAPWLRYVRLLLAKLIGLKNEVEKDKEHLFSVSQEKLLKRAVEILVCLGIIAHLNKGIGIPMDKRISHEFTSKLENVTMKEKYYVLNLTLFGVIELQQSKTFESILLNRHLGDVIACTVQLIFDKESVNMEFHKKYLQKLIEETHQQLVIRVLMIMRFNKAVPKLVFEWLNRVLSDRLKANGVVATLRAILDIAVDSKDTPHYWKHVSVLAKILTLKKHVSIYPQLLSLVKEKDNEYRQVAVMSIQLLADSRPYDCDQHFILPLLKPIIQSGSESEFSESIEALHACCGVSSPRCVPPKVLAAGFSHLIRLHAKIRSSVSYLKKKAADLAWSVLSNDENDLEKIFDEAVFSPLPVVFNFGSEGGIYVTEGQDDIDSGDVASSILELYLSHDSAQPKIKFFKMLLSTISQECTLEKKFIYYKLLSELFDNPDIQTELNSDPLCLLPFLKVLLEAPENFGADTVCLGLMGLGVVVDSPFPNKPVSWSQLNILIEPLKNFKSSNTEANVLANELYEMILTRGVVKKTPKQAEKVKTSAEKALEEAVHSLLPVRAHGIRELKKLILAKDPQAIKKKETIFFIFKENLKDEDSYIYVGAIEGIAALSASFPDEALMTLIEEYQAKNHSVEDRLKVGEVLIQVARILNEMSIIYKNEMISCFLVSCCDDDPLIRSSSLSNLGEICKILSFRVTNFLVEILECVRNIYETDKHPEPRRAAVMVLTLLLKGLGEGALSTLETLLLDIYRGLKRVYEHDKDDITRLHAQLALEELRASTLVFLNPIRPFEKRIFVLDPPV